MSYSIALAIAVVASLISATGGAVYLAWNLGPAATALAGAVSAIAAFACLRAIFPKKNAEPGKEAEPAAAWSWAVLAIMGLAGAALAALAKSSTGISLNSPWKAVNGIFWPALIAAAALSGALVPRFRKNAVFLAAFSLLAAALSVAALVYANGYGFDPFIHRAAEKYILDNGAISPRTPYYAGQYALIVLLARATSLPVYALDVWLLPALAALGLAGAAVWAAKSRGERAGYFALALAALLPLGNFINTTPFGLSCLYGALAAVCLTAARSNRRALVAAWIFAAGALLTHPIAGVPAAALAAIASVRSRRIKICIAAAGALSLPVLFAAINGGFRWNPSGWSQVSLPFEMPLARFHSMGDMTYAVGAAAAILVIVGAAASFDHLLAALSSAASAVLVALTIDFSYLPAYEQGGYPGRLIAMALIIAAPAAALALAWIMRRSEKFPPLKLVSAALFAALFAGGAYLAYPREDAYVLSKGWNSSDSDFSAVSAIADRAGGEPYIALASQAVSAAALGKFGFFKYFPTDKGPIFAYPVPTGGELYGYYLKMIYDEPSPEYMRRAMALAGVKRGYFVVNSYWTGAQHVIARAKETAQSWFAINNENYVFEYRQP